MQCITNETGHLVQELSYDAWGNRRDVDTWDVFTTLPTGILLARGFTGHEHLDLFDLINMDGRVYDPVLGRFLSPDPIIQNSENLQSLNRYTYCLNNPLSLTDPSGYGWLSDNWRSLAAAAVAITVSTITAGFGSGFGYAIFVGAVGGFAGSFTGALLEGANIGEAFKAGAIGALIGGISGGLSNGVGSLKFDDILGKMLAHGITQGGISELSGGKFIHGFFSAALSAGLAGTISNEDGTLKVRRGVAVAASAVVGGTASVLGGGKFANGAITGAYVMLFNHMMHDIKDNPNKNIIYQRTTETDKSTTGTFSIPGTDIDGYILEPAGPSTTTPNLDKRIPAGKYNLILNKGAKYGLRLYNDQVSEKRGILMHIGNYPLETRGCLLPGSSVGTNYVGGSDHTLKQIMNYFKKVGFNGATITILDPKHP